MKVLTCFKHAVFAVLLLAACEPPATFTEPQPTSVDSETEFPKRYRGTYVNDEDISAIMIGPNYIKRKYEVNLNMHKSALDSNYTIEGNVVTNSATGEVGDITYKGDSVVVQFHYLDTLFSMSENHILKKFKGYLFMNLKNPKGGWEVRKMALSRGKLSISEISPLDLEYLKEFKVDEQDTVAPYLYSPTKKQFKQFVKNNGFRYTETFTKANKQY